MSVLAQNEERERDTEKSNVRVYVCMFVCGGKEKGLEALQAYDTTPLHH